MRSPADSPYALPGAIMDQRELKEGADYVYSAPYPEGCAGHLYRVERFVLDVPSYQGKILVRALTGADAGLWFVCTAANFCSRYVPAQPAEGERA